MKTNFLRGSIIFPSESICPECHNIGWMGCYGLGGVRGYGVRGGCPGPGTKFHTKYTISKLNSNTTKFCFICNLGRWDEDHLKATVTSRWKGVNLYFTDCFRKGVPLLSLQSDLYAEKQLLLFSSIILQFYFTLHQLLI